MSSKYLKIHIVSDVHLNDKIYDKKLHRENPEKKYFREYLSSLNKNQKINDQAILILNGDIFDITSCWHDFTLPWDYDKEKVVLILKEILTKIIENNTAVINELKLFLANPLNKIVYVIGNHDSALGQHTTAQAIISDVLLADSSSSNDQLSFVDSYEYPELGLYVEHGHRLDPLNASKGGEPCFGEVINIMVINHSVELILNRLKDNGYSQGLIENIESRLYDIEYLRPTSLLPYWIDTIANLYQDHPECQGKTKSIKEIIRQVILDFHKNPWALKYLSQQLKISKHLIRYGIELMLQSPSVLPALSFIISKILRRTHSNSYQSEVAKKLYDSKKYRMIVFGHTHIPVLMNLGANGHYCNTGSWIPVINLHKYSENKTSHMEYLVAENNFNRTEQSGALSIKYDLINPANKPTFALKTIEHGLE